MPKGDSTILPPSPPERWHFPLSAFLSLLQANGFVLGVDTHIQLQVLLQYLALPEDLHRLSDYLTPLLAQTDEQQAFLHIQIPLWFYTERIQSNISVPEIFSPPDQPKKEIDNPSSSRSESTLTDQPKKEKDSLSSSRSESTPPPTPEREKLVLHQSSIPQQSSGLSFAVPYTPVEYPLPVLRSIRQMRFTIETTRQNFDLPGTVKELARRGSLATPRWRYHRRHIEYVMIVEQSIHRDHRAAMVTQLYQTLRRNNVDVLLFTYHTDPRLLQPYRGGDEITLRQVAATHTHSILLYFGSNDYWMSPETLENYRWTDSFRQWEQRYWFPINSPDRWGLQERVGTQIFPQVLPLSMEGLQAMVQQLSFSDNDAVLSLDFWPDHLDFDLTDINTRLPLSDIALFFSTPVRRWIAACAVYPELNWQLTLAVGRLLSPPGWNLCEAEAISQLLRLDWFRNGHIPQPVRYALLQEWLDQPAMARVHGYIATLMRDDIRYETLSRLPAFRMQLALHELMAETTSDRQQALTDQLQADLAAGHHPPDLVGLHYLSQSQLGPFSFVIPDKLVEYFESIVGWDLKSDTLAGSVRGPDMVFIPGGTFEMGDGLEDNVNNYEKPIHPVTLSDFYLGRYAVTFDEYDAFCMATGRKKPGDEGWGRGRRPVINVSWYDAVEYCNWLSEQQGYTPYYIDKYSSGPKKNDEYKPNWTVNDQAGANGYRLPTEAEWEYAARQRGEKVRFGNGKNVANPKEINFDSSRTRKKNYSIVGEYRKETVPVGSLNDPNSLGLHDMSGNVLEWCWDWYGPYSKGSQTNPNGPESGSNRVRRGGSWGYSPQNCRATYRGLNRPTNRYFSVGFRLARSF